MNPLSTFMITSDILSVTRLDIFSLQGTRSGTGLLYMFTFFAYMEAACISGVGNGKERKDHIGRMAA